jgi:hypothetical protein
LGLFNESEINLSQKGFALFQLKLFLDPKALTAICILLSQFRIELTIDSAIELGEFSGIVIHRPSLCQSSTTGELFVERVGTPRIIASANAFGYPSKTDVEINNELLINKSSISGVA